MSQAPAVSPVDEVIEFFSHGPSRQEIATFELSGAAQDRLRVLLRKNAAGALTGEEEHELDKMVLLDDIISLIRVRAQRPTATSPGSSDPTHA
ncbi:MAG TPA: hypothetical protein VIG30_05400 [Ktedonobacterales bacterium]|jgi:hypothetical protein